jgi:hypothetical protein
VNLDRHRTTFGIGHQSEDDLQFALVVVARVAQFTERPVAAFEMGGGQIVWPRSDR